MRRSHCRGRNPKIDVSISKSTNAGTCGSKEEIEKKRKEKTPF